MFDFPVDQGRYGGNINNNPFISPLAPRNSPNPFISPLAPPRNSPNPAAPSPQARDDLDNLNAWFDAQEQFDIYPPRRQRRQKTVRRKSQRRG